MQRLSRWAALAVATTLLTPACASSDAHAAERRARQGPGPTVVTDRMIEINEGITLPVIKRAQKQLLDLDTQSHDPIWIRLNSPGGAVDAGLILIDTMMALRSPTHCIVESKAYSMAAIILTFCDRRYGYVHSTYMLHEASYGTVGEDPSNRSKLDFLTRYLDGMHETIARNLGMNVKDYRARIRDAWWLLAAEALEVGLIEEIITEMAYSEFPKEQTEVKRTVTHSRDVDTVTPAGPTIPKRRD